MNDLERKEIFNNWLKAHRGLIFKVIRVYSDTSDDRDDLFQEVCFQIWKSIPSFKGQSAVTTWLYRISLNTSIKWIKKENRQPSEHLSESYENLLKEVDHADDRIDWLYQEIHKMNEIDKSLTLLLMDGLDYKEMSEIVGLTANNIGVRIHRIKNDLMKKSKKYVY